VSGDTHAGARRPPAPTAIAAWCLDRPDAAAARRAATADHLRWVESMLGHVAVAGPLYSEDGARMIGSLYVFHTGSLDQARSWLEGDPFHAAGMWQTIDLRPFLPAAGTFVGGRSW
jgi:hypothetical protein